MPKKSMKKQSSLDNSVEEIELDKKPKEEKTQETKEKKDKIKAYYFQGKVVCEDSNAARDAYTQSRYGEIQGNGKLHLSLVEGLFLLEKERLEITDGRNKVFDSDFFVKKAGKLDKFFLTRYAVFKDLRNRGYIVKTALKFGADFRVYDRGVKPGDDHAKWVVYPVKEDASLTWYEFAAKNRVAHSTKKRLLLAVVDDEGDVSYWECRWIRP